MWPNKSKVLLFIAVIAIAGTFLAWMLTNAGPFFPWESSDPMKIQAGRPQIGILNKSFQAKIKSGNLSTDYDIELALEDVKALKLNTVNVPIIVHIDSLASSTMSLDWDSIEKAKALIKKLKKMNINVILEPYPWIGKGEFYETEWNPSSIKDFFDNWEKGVIEPIIQKVAVPEKVEALCIASNFLHIEKYEDAWCQLIENIKGQYQGLITYKSNWWYTAVWDIDSQERFQKKLHNKLFSKVDFISFAAYFELSNRPEHSVETLKNALYATPIYQRGQNIVSELEQFHLEWNKPIFFGELGFPKRNFAAKEPWNPSPSEVENEEEQARCFQAYQEVFTQDWFLGFSVFSIGERSEDKHFYPSKESQKVIWNWFG